MGDLDDDDNSLDTVDTAETARTNDATTITSTALETGYRKALMLLPRTYWAKHSEEMLAVLLDNAEPGQTKPNPREVLSVAFLSLRLRFASANAGGRAGTVAGDIARRAVLAVLIFNFATLMQWNAFAGGFGYSLVPVLLQAGLITTLIQGWTWPARVLCAAYAAFTIHHLLGQSSTVSNLWYGGYNVVTPLVIAVVAAVAFHRRAPRLPGRAWWFTAFVAITAVFWLWGKTIDHMLLVDLSHRPVLPAVLSATAVGMTLWKAKTFTVWPAALALAGLPYYGGTMLRFLIRSSPLGSSPDAVYIELGMVCEVILLCVALASFVFTRYQRRTATRGSEPV